MTPREESRHSGVKLGAVTPLQRRSDTNTSAIGIARPRSSQTADGPCVTRSTRSRTRQFRRSLRNRIEGSWLQWSRVTKIRCAQERRRSSSSVTYATQSRQIIPDAQFSAWCSSFGTKHRRTSSNPSPKLGLRSGYVRPVGASKECSERSSRRSCVAPLLRLVKRHPPAGKSRRAVHVDLGWLHRKKSVGLGGGW